MNCLLAQYQRDSCYGEEIDCVLKYKEAGTLKDLEEHHFSLLPSSDNEQQYGNWAIFL